MMWCYDAQLDKFSRKMDLVPICSAKVRIITLMNFFRPLFTIRSGIIRKEWQLHTPIYILPGLLLNIKWFVYRDWYMGLTSWSSDIAGLMVMHWFSWTYGMWAHRNPIWVVSTMTAWYNCQYEGLQYLQCGDGMTWRSGRVPRGKEGGATFYASNPEEHISCPSTGPFWLCHSFPQISNAQRPTPSVNVQCPMLHRGSGTAHSPESDF